MVGWDGDFNRCAKFSSFSGEDRWPFLAHARWDLMRSLRNRYHLAAQRGLVELMDAGHHTALAACSSKFPNKLPKNSENPYQEPTNETN
jgi:hypothetical protein